MQAALGLWQTGHPVILGGGYVWAAVGSQLGGVEGPIKVEPLSGCGAACPHTKGAEQAIAESNDWY